jgi:hypothetical protein
VVSLMAVLAAAAFGASFVFAQEAQEGRAFLVWHVQIPGGSQVTDEGRNILQGLVGQPAVGTMFSDDEDREQFELTLGFHTGVMAGPDAFASLVQNLALTPLATQEAASTETPTPGPTESPTETSTEVPSSPTATTEPQTPTATAESQPSTATATPVPPSPTATAPPIPTPSPQQAVTPVPSTAMPPADTPSPTVIPPPSPTSEPAPTRTPIFIVVTEPPAEQPPAPTATPVPPSGGICSVPGNGPLPLDVGLLLILAAPIVLWRFGIRP